MSSLLRTLIALALFVVWSGLNLAGCSQLLAPNVQTQLVKLRSGQYELDPAHSAVLFKVEHLGLSTFVGRFEQVEASLDFDASAITDAKLQAVIDMASVNVNNEDFEETLRGGSWFDVKTYPQAVFQSTSAQALSANVVRFLGKLTFLGVTKEVALDVTFNGGAMNMLTAKYTIGFEATSRFSRSDFGLDQYVGLVGDDITIEVYAEFLRR